MLKGIKYRFFQEFHTPHCLCQNNFVFQFEKNKRKILIEQHCLTPNQKSFSQEKHKGNHKSKFNKQES